MGDWGVMRGQLGGEIGSVSGASPLPQRPGRMAPTALWIPFPRLEHSRAGRRLKHSGASLQGNDNLWVGAGLPVCVPDCERRACAARLRATRGQAARQAGTRSGRRRTGRRFTPPNMKTCVSSRSLTAALRALRSGNPVAAAHRSHRSNGSSLRAAPACGRSQAARWELSAPPACSRGQ